MACTGFDGFATVHYAREGAKRVAGQGVNLGGSPTEQFGASGSDAGALPKTVKAVGSGL
jgi:hypothetical protein